MKASLRENGRGLCAPVDRDGKILDSSVGNFASSHVVAKNAGLVSHKGGDLFGLHVSELQNIFECKVN